MAAPTPCKEVLIGCEKACKHRSKLKLTHFLCYEEVHCKPEYEVTVCCYSRGNPPAAQKAKETCAGGRPENKVNVYAPLPT